MFLQYAQLFVYKSLSVNKKSVYRKLKSVNVAFEMLKRNISRAILTGLRFSMDVQSFTFKFILMYMFSFNLQHIVIYYILVEDGVYLISFGVFKLLDKYPTLTNVIYNVSKNCSLLDESLVPKMYNFYKNRSYNQKD